MLVRSYTLTCPNLPITRRSILVNSDGMPSCDTANERCRVEKRQAELQNGEVEGGKSKGAAVMESHNGTFDLTTKPYFPTAAQPGGALSNLLDCMPLVKRSRCAGRPGRLYTRARETSSSQASTITSIVYRSFWPDRGLRRVFTACTDRDDSGGRHSSARC